MVNSSDPAQCSIIIIIIIIVAYVSSKYSGWHSKSP
jgi:hypothetical protein